jgi:Kef-type K+ transport system membrane component KefB
VHPVLTLGVLLAVGWPAGVIASRLRLPRITGYLVAGVILSPSVLALVPRSTIDDLSIVAVVALGIIGYAIGGSVRLDSLRALGGSIAWITVGQGMVVWAVTIAVITPLGPWLLDVPGATARDTYFPVALVLGAIAWLTAPAVTIALIREYRSAGPLTTTSLSVVALSDVGGIIAFAFAVGVAQSLMGAGDFSFLAALVMPLTKVIGALVLGAFLGHALIRGGSRVEWPPAGVLAIVLSGILLCTWLASLIGVSTVLACMVMGFVVANGSTRLDLVGSLQRVESVVFIVFFVLSGMNFDWEAMSAAGLLAIAIFVTRTAGKYAGAQLGASLSGAPVAVRKYVGIALLPKAGLTIGMAFLAVEAFPGLVGELIFNGLLAATVINMLVTPPLVKYAIFASGERAQASSG